MEDNNNIPERSAKERLMDEPFTGFEETPRYPGTAPPVYDSSNLTMAGLPSGESDFMELMKGILGAVIGCIPGFVLWILIGKLGVLAAVCGALLAGGAVWGFIFMTKDDFLDEKYCAIVCIVVCIFAIYLAQRIVFCWNLTDGFIELRKTLISTYNTLSEISDSEPKSAEAAVDELFLEKFGFTEGTFSNFFFNFGRVKRELGLGGSFFFRLLESYVFGILGGLSIFKKKM